LYIVIPLENYPVSFAATPPRRGIELNFGVLLNSPPWRGAVGGVVFNWNYYNIKNATKKASR
jgi:hypothetical protein